MRTLLSLPLAALLVVASVGLTGCGEEEDAARIVVDVISLNGNETLFSDVYSTNNTPDDPNDDYIPVDRVEVTFQARPHDDILTLSPNGPFGSVRFTKFQVQFIDGMHSRGADLNGDGIIDLENFTAPMNAVVSVYGEASSFILIVGGGVKTEFPLRDLIFGGEYRTNAKITFYGEEETSGKGIEVVRNLDISLANFGDK